MLLEDSHQKADRIRNYLQRDVDAYCTNKPWGQLKENGWSFDGTLAKNAASLRRKIGGRWLTAEYEPGDVLIFGMGMIHASIDNRTNRIRLSSDTRYQRADQPADERWIGQDPPGHGPRAKKGLLC
jgi:ectoine hydroxylase-related dioxygenase (phytanoyl-CoA dioxygenase family)